MNFYLMQCSGSHRDAMAGEDFVDAILNTSTAGSNGEEEPAE
jgi:hypothetical protein